MVVYTIILDIGKAEAGGFQFGGQHSNIDSYSDKKQVQVCKKEREADPYIIHL
jgi:hypothetical protein